MFINALFFCIITLFVPTLLLTPLNANISWNTTFITIVILCSINTGHINLFLLFTFLPLPVLHSHFIALPETGPDFFSSAISQLWPTSKSEFEDDLPDKDDIRGSDDAFTDMLNFNRKIIMDHLSVKTSIFINISGLSSDILLGISFYGRMTSSNDWQFYHLLLNNKLRISRPVEGKGSKGLSPCCILKGDHLRGCKSVIRVEGLSKSAAIFFLSFFLVQTESASILVISKLWLYWYYKDMNSEAHMYL